MTIAKLVRATLTFLGISSLVAAGVVSLLPLVVAQGHGEVTRSRLEGNVLVFPINLFDAEGRFLVAAEATRPTVPAEGEPIEYLRFMPSFFWYGSKSSPVAFYFGALLLALTGGSVFWFRAMAIREQNRLTPTFGKPGDQPPPSACDGMCLLGSFEPMEAKRVLPLLESANIKFNIEAENSALGVSNRFVFVYWGFFPEGSKINVYVPEDKLDAVMEIVKRLFPV